MADPTPQPMTCPSCGKGYRWRADLVGKVLPCKQCGGSFAVPTTPGLMQTVHKEDDGTYELDLDESQDPHDAAPASKPKATQPPAHDGKCPSCNSPLKEHAVLCLNCGFNVSEGKKIQTAIAEPPGPDEPIEDDEPKLTKQEKRDAARIADAQAQHHWQDYKLPAILIGVGFVLFLLNILLVPSSDYASYGLATPMEKRIGYLIGTVFSTTVQAGLIFAGLLLLVALFGAAFGGVGSVILKVLAITIVVQQFSSTFVIGMDITMGMGLLAILLKWLVYLGLMIGLFVKLLDLDGAEIRVMIAFIVVGRFATNFLAGVLIMSFF